MPTRHQVADAAASLERLGERVTVRAVQTITGGSLRDVTPLVKAWQGERVATEKARQQAPEVPEEVRDLLARAAVEAWSLAHRYAGGEAAELRRNIAELQQSAEAAAKDGEAVIAELEAEIAAAKATLQEASFSIDTLTKKLANARDAVARAEASKDAALEQASLAERRAAEAENRADERIQRLEAALELLNKSPKA